MLVPKAHSILQAAFRDPVSGKIYGTGPTHNIENLPEGISIDEVVNYDLGYMTFDGKFLNRLEATKMLGLNRPVQSQQLELHKNESLEHDGYHYDFKGPELEHAHYKITAYHKNKEVGNFTFWAKPVADIESPHFGWHRVGGTHVNVLHRKRGINAKMMQIAAKFVKDNLDGKGIVSEGSWREDAATRSWEGLARRDKRVKSLPSKQDPDLQDFRLSELDDSEALEKMAIADIRVGQPVGEITTTRKTGFPQLKVNDKPRKILVFDYSHTLPDDVRQEGYKLLLHDYNHPDNGITTGNLRAIVVHKDNPSKILGETEGFVDTVGKFGKIIFTDELPKKLMGRKVGKALYNSFAAHVFHYHKIKQMSGGVHSTLASQVHQSMVRQHDVDYKAVPNTQEHGGEFTEKEWNEKSSGPFDDKYRPYAYTLKSEINSWLLKKSGGLDYEITDADHDIGAKMISHSIRETPQYQAALFITHRPPTVEALREALVRWDTDFEMAILEAFGMRCDDEGRKSLRGVAKLVDLHKSDLEVAAIPRDILAPHSDGKKTEAALVRGMEAALVRPVKFNGKHSKGMAIIKDPQDGKKYLIKPGSGNLSPSAGVSEEKGSQSSREVAFAKIAKLIGLDKFVADAEIVMVDEMECAALDLLAGSYEGMDKRKKDQDPQDIFRSYYQDGSLFKWAVLDEILANSDRHAGNIMVNDEGTVKLIDHGSAFAGSSFNPSGDPKSFIPYYLRAFTSDSFHTMEPDERYDAMPQATKLLSDMIGNWIESFDEGRITGIMKEYGLNPTFVIDRIKFLKSLPIEDRLDWVLSFYAGLTSDD